MNEPYLQVIAHYFAKPGNGDRVIELLAELAPATRAEPKNLDYAYFRSPEHPDHIVILERYRDADGLDDAEGHILASVRELVSTGMPVLAQVPTDD